LDVHFDKTFMVEVQLDPIALDADVGDPAAKLPAFLLDPLLLDFVFDHLGQLAALEHQQVSEHILGVHQ